MPALVTLLRVFQRQNLNVYDIFVTWRLTRTIVMLSNENHVYVQLWPPLTMVLLSWSVHGVTDVLLPDPLIPGCNVEEECPSDAECCLDGICAQTIDDCGEYT